MTEKKCTKCGGPRKGKNSWCNKCLCERTKAYYKTPEGRAKRLAWRQTAKAKAYEKEYNAGAKAKESRERWRKSDDGKECYANLQRLRAKRKNAANLHGIRPVEIRRIREAATHCAYCGFLLEKRTIDHVQPLCLGGAHSFKNITVCCKACNSRKASMSAAQWFSVIGRVLDFECVPD